jgi:hypothetical protein
MLPCKEKMTGEARIAGANTERTETTLPLVESRRDKNRKKAKSPGLAPGCW